jgi:protease-4
MEGLTAFAQKQIERAAHDNTVKAVVVRINSPGGSITASDDLHHRLTELRDGNPTKKTNAKPLVVSMASLAASGGYYIAMPAKTLLAERTTITGSIGVYAALPDATELSKKIGFTMNVIRAGDVKDSGDPFREMTPHERELWQYMVDRSYLQFLKVVEEGRPPLKGKFQEDLVIDEVLPVREGKLREKPAKFTRYRADGGIFTAEEAKKYGLIDQIGYLEDAIQVAKQAAALGDDYKVVLYEKIPTFLGTLLGVKAPTPAFSFDPGQFSSAATPRLWYLAPQAEWAGLVSAAGER